jgi:hypothetical protein
MQPKMGSISQSSSLCLLSAMRIFILVAILTTLLPETAQVELSVARCWCLMPIILVTQEADIKKIVVQSIPRQIVHKMLSQK